MICADFLFEIIKAGLFRPRCSGEFQGHMVPVVLTPASFCFGSHLFTWW